MEAQTKTHRVQVDFTERGYAQLLELQRRTGASSVSALVALALSTLAVSVGGEPLEEPPAKSPA